MMASNSKRIIVLAVISTVTACSQLLFADMNTQKINLPHKIDTWTLSGPVRPINAENIFEYMNGAGELYLGYGFMGYFRSHLVLNSLYYLSHQNIFNLAHFAAAHLC